MGADTFRRALTFHLLNTTLKRRRLPMGRYLIYSIIFLALLVILWHLLVN